MDSWQVVPRLAESATPAEQFSIWAIRMWWGAFPELDTVWAELARGFRFCAAPSALEACHRFCSVMLCAAGCGSGIACIHCPRITPLEDRLLEALAAARTNEYLETEMLLRQLVPASAARIAAPYAARFARDLAEAGLQWPGSPRAATVRALDPAPDLLISERLH
jgi:hypothetical protein